MYSTEFGYYCYRTVQLILGLVFVASGILKLFSPATAAQFINTLFSTNQFMSIFLVIVLVIFETAIGLMLIRGRMIALAACAAGAMMLASIVVVGLLVPSPTPCGCFGNWIDSKTGAVFLLRNFVLLALSLFILRKSEWSDREQIGNS